MIAITLMHPLHRMIIKSCANIHSGQYPQNVMYFIKYNVHFFYIENDAEIFPAH